MAGGPFEELVGHLVELTESELDARLRAVELQRRALDAELAALVAVGDAKGVYLADGHRSMAGYLKATCNWSNSETSRVRNAAATVNAHPVVGDGWFAGRFSASQVTELSMTRTDRCGKHRFAEFVDTFVGHAEQLPYRDFRTLLARYRQLAAGFDPVREAGAVASRSVTATEVGGELFLTRQRRRQPHHGGVLGDPRPVRTGRTPQRHRSA